MEGIATWSMRGCKATHRSSSYLHYPSVTVATHAFSNIRRKDRWDIDGSLGISLRRNILLASFGTSLYPVLN